MALIFVAAATAVPYLGEEFMPNFREYDFLMHWVEKPGPLLDATRQWGFQRGSGHWTRGSVAWIRVSEPGC